MKVLRLMTIAASLGVVAATLPSHFASATPTMPSGNTQIQIGTAMSLAQGRAFKAALKAFGGLAAFKNGLAMDDRSAVMTCISLTSCLDHFGGKLGPDNVEA